MLPALIMTYNHGKKAPGTKPQFKSPETEANKLLMFNDLKDETLLQNFEIENAAEGKKEMYAMGGFVENVFTEWAEDHLNDFGQDTYSTNLPVFDYTELGRRIQTARAARGSQITALSNTSTSNIVPEKADKHLFLRSVIDGGNMLPAPQFAIIGKDSLLATEIQNGISEEEAKQLIADEYGYKSENLCFVEQPDYHIDLMIMLLGGNKVMIKPNSNGIQLTNTTIRDLKDFKHPPLEVQVDEEELAGKQTADKKWEYNFFNGEYVKGKDNELYYITNGTTNDEAQEKFKAFMLKETGVKDVIFSPSINSNLLNETKGGAGCRFKGAKSS